MTYEELVKALRSASAVSTAWEKLMRDAAAAIEALNRLLDQNTQRCEALRKQLREAHESYERHLNELEAQLPKRGEWVGVSPTVDTVQCTVCGGQLFSAELETPYCPYCGAKMEVQDGQ